MAFKSVPDSRGYWHVVDEDRGIELKHLSGSSGGGRHFRVISKVDSVDVSALLSFGPLEGEVADDLSAKSVLRWTLPKISESAQYRFGSSEGEVALLRQVLAEAFEQHCATGRPMDDRIVEVQFGAL